MKLDFLKRPYRVLNFVRTAELWVRPEPARLSYWGSDERFGAMA